MPCSACGYAVDALRSCYRSWWNLPGVGLIQGEYSFVAEGTPWYPEAHWLGSRNWHAGDSTPWPTYGEVESARQYWRNGSVPVPVPSDVLVNDQSTIGSTLHGGNYGAFHGTIQGYDRRCWRHGQPWPEDAGAPAVALGLTANSAQQYTGGGPLAESIGLTGSSVSGLVGGGPLAESIGLTGSSVSGLVGGGPLEEAIGLTGSSVSGLVGGGPLEEAIGLTGSGSQTTTDQAGAGASALGLSATAVLLLPPGGANKLKLGLSATGHKFP